MKTLIRLLPVFLLIGAVAAQTVNITGTVKDSNGNVYVNGSGVISLVPSNQQWLFNGTNPVNSPIPIAQLSSTGQFSVQLINTSLISPASANPQWQFSFCSNAALTKTPICFTMTPLALTSSQDITTQIVAQAAILPSSGSGGCITIVSKLTTQCGAITGTVASVTDGSNSSDCSIGGGSNTNVCIYTGTQWIFAGSAAPNPAFNQVGSGTNANTLLVAGSLGPVTLGTITATGLSSPYIDWNAATGGASIKNKPVLNVYSNLTAAVANLSLPNGTNTTTYTSADFGVSPVAAIYSYTTTATSATDTSFEVGITSPAGSYHNPFIATVGANQLFAACSTGGATPVGFVVVGIFTPSMTCPLLTQTPLSRFWDIVATSSHVDATFYEAANGYTANLVQMFAHTPAGTGFNFLVTCAGANNTGGTCTTPIDTIRGDGQLTVPSEVISGLTPGTTPICPNGTGGALTTTGCSGGGGGFPNPVGIAGNLVAGTPTISQEFLPPVDVRLFFTTPYPTYAQAQSQDFGAVMNAAFTAATPTGACVDVSGLNQLNAPNIAEFYASTNMYAGLVSNTYVPCIIGANFLLTTGATQSTPGGSIVVRGGAPGGIGGTGMVIQPCNTNPTCNGTGGFTVPQFQTSGGTGGCSTVGGTNCYATGLPSSPALTTITTGTVTVTLGSRTVTASSGNPWTAAVVGGTFISDCNNGTPNVCSIGSTSTYVSGRIVAESGGNTLTLEANYAGASNTLENYIIFNPNTSVAWCDGCLANNLQKSFTGHEITNLTIDLNGISGAGFYTKASQEGSVLNNFTCFLQFGSPAAATAGGTCLAWDQTVREASGSGQTFLGHWSVTGGRIGMGQNTGGALAFGCVVEGFSAMDGSVALSQANGASVFELQAIIGGGGGHQFQDACQIDGISGMNVIGTHTESTINDHWNVGPRNPAYNVVFSGITSSGTMGNCVVEFNTNTSGNQIHGVSRPSGGCLAKDDNLSTPTIGTSVSGTPASWTIPEYIQAGNANVSIVASGNAVVTGVMTATQFQWVGPIYIQGPIPASVMLPGNSGNTAIGVSSDGNLYISNNAAPIDEFATAANTLTFTNKSISGSANTLTNIGNSALTNSSITIAGTSVALGGSTTSFPSPGAIGGTTPAAITGTTIQANTQINAGSAGTLAPLIMGNATSGLLTIQPATGAITSYTIDFPVAQPTAGNTFLSCTAANPAICTWASAGGAVALSAITAATTSNTPLANGNNVITWNWAGTSANTCLLCIGETTASTTGPTSIVQLSTLAGSVATPLNITNSLTGSQTLAALSITPTWNTTGVVDAALLVNVTNTASATGSLLADFQVGGGSKVNIDKSGDVAAGNYGGQSTASNITLCGGLSTCLASSTAGSVGSIIMEGADNSNAGAAALGGSTIIRSGHLTNATPNASALPGLIQEVQSFKIGTIANAFDIVASTTTAVTVSDCAVTPCGNPIGIAILNSNPVAVVYGGEVPVKLQAGDTAAVGDYICLSTTTAGLGHTNGSTKCTAGQGVGYVVAIAGSPKGLTSATAISTYTLSTSQPLVMLHWY